MTLSKNQTRRTSSSYPQTVQQPEWSTSLAQADSQVPNTSYVALPLIHDPLAQADDDKIDMNGGSIYSFSSPIAFTGVNSPQIPLKASWEQSRKSKPHSGSSKSGGTYSRIKKEQAGPRKGPSSSGSKGYQLRCTKKGRRFSYTDENGAADIEGTKGLKTSHNVVEKQYRTRLNAQFSKLLGYLPSDMVGAEVEGYGRDDSGRNEKKVSKAEVLMLAKRHIKKLEDEKKNLEDGNKELLENMTRLRAAWVRMGGQGLP